MAGRQNRFERGFFTNNLNNVYYIEIREAILARLKNDPLSFFQGVRPLIDDSDHLIINLETVLADDPSNPLAGKKYPNWDNPDRTIDVLKKIGVTAVSLTNNHTMDFGPDLMLESRQKLRDAGIDCFGAGSDLTEASRPGQENAGPSLQLHCQITHNGKPGSMACRTLNLPHRIR